MNWQSVPAGNIPPVASAADILTPAGSGVSGRRFSIPPVPAVSGVRRIALRFADRISDAGLVVDLGDSIGSLRWWRGAATLFALCGAATHLGFSAPPLIGPVPPRESGAVSDERAADAIAPLSEGATTGRRMVPARTAERLAEPPERPQIALTANVGSGGLEGALRRAGVGRSDLDDIRRGLSGVVRMNGVAPGTRLDLVMGRRESRSDPRPLESLLFRAAFDLNVRVERRGENLNVVRVPIAVDNTPLRVVGAIGGSLSRSARAAGLPQSIVSEYMRQMAQAVDLQRDVGRSDRFEIIVAHRRAATGETEMGQLLYAGLSGGKKNVGLMRWGGKGQFYRENGEGARKGLLRMPIDGARISSTFGMRFHPILNFSRLHAGTDFAAGTGTPILASASGRVVRSGWGGGYGNVVMIDHGKGVSTRYAHMSKLIAKAGTQVRQGEVIGLVGSSGLATGPHLHYEVWVNGKPVDPKQAKFETSEKLAGRDLAGFRAQLQQLKRVQAAGD